MKTLRAKFRGGFSPRRQGGWIGVAAMVVGSVIKGIGDAKSAHQQQKQAYSRLKNACLAAAKENPNARAAFMPILKTIKQLG